MRIDAKLVNVICHTFSCRIDKFYTDTKEEPYVTARAVFVLISWENRVPVPDIAEYLATNVNTVYSRLKSIREKIKRGDSCIINDLVCIRETLLK